MDKFSLSTLSEQLLKQQIKTCLAKAVEQTLVACGKRARLVNINMNVNGSDKKTTKRRE